LRLRYISAIKKSIRLKAITYAVLCLAAFSQAGAQEKSLINGDCVYDPATNQTTCTYQVFSGIPALSHLIFPIPENCVGRFTVSSSFFQFGTAQIYNDPFCGSIYGIKADQEVPEGHSEMFTVTYDAAKSFDIGLVYAALKGGPGCQWFSVPAVMDCSFQPDCHFSLDYTVHDFSVKKPGVYAGTVATMVAVSNLPINITFESFGDLNPVQSMGTGQIPAFYATAPAELTEPPEQFLTPADFNQQVVIIPGDEQEHRFSIWLKLMVSKQISACEYENNAVIRVEIENLEDYIEPIPIDPNP